jgi:hypothetical protein
MLLVHQFSPVSSGEPQGYLDFGGSPIGKTYLSPFYRITSLTDTSCY